MKIKILSYLIWLVILSYLGYSCDSATSSSIEISAEDFLKENDSAISVVLDVRTSQEFESGHLPGAVLVDIYTPGTEERLLEFDLSKTYYVYCHSGARSHSIVHLMRKQGFKKSYNIKGGIIKLARAGASFVK
jgi:rhodanese-related sulfurtransferase